MCCGSWFLYLILALFSLPVYLYWYMKNKYTYWDGLGVPNIKPKLTVGNVLEAISFRRPFPHILREWYDNLKPHKFGGVYLFHRPTLVLRDPDIIKSILTKDFEYFNDRGMVAYPDIEPMFNNLLTMTGDEWKNLRIKLTCTFTSGKMKMMFHHLKSCGEKFERELEKMAESGSDFEVKDITSKYTIDVIALCAFGLEANALSDPDSEFNRMGKLLFKFRYQSFIRMIFPRIPKWIVKHFKLYLFDPNVGDYFLKIIQDTVKYREENNVTRNDFLDLLIALKNNTDLEKFKDQHDEADLEKFLAQIGGKRVKSDVDMTIELMAAQCFVFFGAGFDAASSAISFAILELAQHPDIQAKLRNEIRTLLHSDHEQTLTYDLLKKMTYLDMVVSETLRVYPSGGALGRLSLQDYKLPGTNIVIPPKTTILIPLLGLHLDEEHYEKPNQFYPQHFSEENKARRHHYAYLPFGEGPRVCIAERFGLMQIKVGLIYMIRQYEFRLAKNMKVPVEFANSFGFLKVKNGIWVTCTKVE